VQDSHGVSASEMTYIVSGGALNSTHSIPSAYWLNTHVNIQSSILNLVQLVGKLGIFSGKVR